MTCHRQVMPSQKKHVLETELGKTSIGLLFAEMELVRKELFRYVKDLDQEMIDYTPDIKTFETIGTMLFHIADAENSWIFEHIDKEPMDMEKWKYSFPLRQKLDPIQQTGKPIEHYIDLLNEVRAKIKVRLQQFGEDDGEIIHTSSMGKTSIEWTLFHIQRHESHHIGQIGLLKRLYKLENKKVLTKRTKS